MERERFQRAASIFEAALDIGAGERAEFITTSCTGDDELSA